MTAALAGDAMRPEALRLGELRYHLLAGLTVESTRMTSSPRATGSPWSGSHPTGSLVAAAQGLDLAITDVEVLCADLVAAEMIEQTRMQ